MTLPDEMSGGGRISGAFMIAPAGKTEEERQKNADVLSGYVARIGGKDCKVRDGNFSLLVPLGIATLGVALSEPGGKRALNLDVPIEEGPNLFPSVVMPKTTDFEMPALTQFGKPITIRGPFDGNYATTSLSYGGKNLPVLAETDGKVVSGGNSQLVGKGEIILNEQNVLIKSTANNVRPASTADKSTLLENETTVCHATVDGLEGLGQENYPIAVEFKILTENIKYTTEAGHRSTKTIDFDEVKNGTWATDFKITGINPGPFSLSMTAAYTLLHDIKDGMTVQEFQDWMNALIETYNNEIKKIDEEEKKSKEGGKELDKGKAMRRNILKKTTKELGEAKDAATGGGAAFGLAKRMADKTLADLGFIEMAVSMVDFAADLFGYKDIPLPGLSTVLKGLKSISKGKKLKEIIEKAEKAAEAIEKAKELQEKAEKAEELKKTLEEYKKELDKQK